MERCFLFRYCGNPYYIQAFHVSDVEARQEAQWVESIKIEPPAKAEELGQWSV
jgi:hypothetical protein